MYYKIYFIRNGKNGSIVIKAKSQNEAISIFKSKRLGIIKKIEEVNKEAIFSNLIKYFESKKINLEELVFILNQMYVMLDAGIGIDEVLNNILGSIKDRKLKRIFTFILEDIQSGNSLYNAFIKYKDYLGELVISMIRLGEESGDLAGSIKELAIILEEILENKRRLKKATRYPIFIIFAMAIGFTIVVLFVIPPFKFLFAQLHNELPLPTRFLLWLEYAIENFGPYIVAGGIIFAIILSYLHKKNYKIRLFLDRVMLKIYIVGDVIYFALIGRFTYIFYKLIDAGIPLVDSFDIALNIVENEFLKSKLMEIKKSIVSGGSISKGFEESGVFESMIIQIIKTGEGSGALVAMMKKVSDYYKTKYRDLVDNISALIEPILIAAIAGFVLTLALGIFLPMWNLTESMG